MDHDLVRAAADAVHTCITPQTRNAVILGIADAAEYLHGVVSDLEACLSAVELAQCRVNIDGHTVVFLPCGLVQVVAHVLDLDAHIAELLLDLLVGADGLAELDALCRVIERVIVAAGRDAEGVGRDDQTLDLEVLHNGHEALALFADHVALFDDDIVQIDLAHAAGAV